MRIIITRIAFILLLVTGIKSIGLAQNVYTDPYPKWRLGLNAGGTWQTNDVKKNYAGLAGGFNIERILNKKEDAPIGFSLGFRYLSGNSRGYDNNKNSGLKFNKGLNGTNDSIAKYDSIPGYFHNNYFTHLAEGDLELKINFPAMEKRSKLIFHVFGGLGFNKYKTRIDALDKDGKMYDYSKLNTSPSVGDVKSFYGTNFETLADRDNANGQLVFTPSLGLGLGFRLSKHVAFVFEHKVSFPFTNTLDGVQYTNTNTKLQGNDIYHYTSANLIFTIWGKSHSTNTNSNTNTNTNVNTNTNTNNNVVTNNGNNQPKPVINIYSPTTNPSTSYTNVQQVSGTIQYVNSASNVSINVNGNQVTNYTFNPNNGSFSFGANLLGGTNTVNISASNSAGQDNENITINYTAQNVTTPVIDNERPPVVQITYPANNYSTTLPSVNVNATVTNITNSSNIAISANGSTISNFNFNSYNGSISFVAPLIQGTNSIIVSAFNSAGNDAKQVFVVYKSQNVVAITQPLGLKPVVSFNNPSSSPFESTTNTFNVTARVTNVTTANEVAVQYNGLPISNFTLNQYGFVNFAVTLNEGSNTVVVTGTNTSGSDTKMATINFKAAGFPPVITLINPPVSPITVTTPNTNVVATVKNIDSQNNISVTINNAPSQFTYNTTNHSLTIPVNLNVGTNIVSISATTNFGNDIEIVSIERKESAVKKPIVTIVSPGTNPYVSNSPSVPVTAQVLNAGLLQINVVNSVNQNIPFTFDPATQLVSFTPTLGLGLNTFTVKASNPAGADSKAITIDYKQNVVVTPKPSVFIIDPGVSPYVTNDISVNLKAGTTNVGTQQEVSVLVNGAVAPFTFNSSSKEINVPLNLSFGSNVITVSVSNAGGVDSKTQIIDRIKQVMMLPPVITVINPASSPYVSSAPNYTVSAEVLNVSSAGISVTEGIKSVQFNYDNTTHLLTFIADETTGGSTYAIKATNLAGSDSKSVIINYVKRAGNSNTIGTNGQVVEISKPVVSISVPNSANSTTTNSTQSVVASVSNVTSASQVSVLVNGNAITNFVYNNGNVTFTANLNLGNNTISVSGTNAAGSDSKAVSVLYKKVIDGGTGTTLLAKPIVTFATPNLLSSISSTATQNVSATVLNVTGSSQVSVLVNGAAVNNFTYNNGSVTFVANLNLGNNTISISGTNAVGNDSKTVSVLYKKIVDGGTGTTLQQKPVVTFINPGQQSSLSSNEVQNVSASVTNVTSASQITVLVNGTNLSNFTYNNGNVSFATNLILGNNTIVVTGTNAVGNDSKSISILYKKVADVGTGTTLQQKPVVTFVSPALSSSLSSTETQNISATVTNVTSSQVAVLVNGSPVTNFNYSNGNVGFTANLNLGNNTVTITGTNAVGNDSKTITVLYKRVADVGIGTTLQQKPVVIFVAPNQVNTTVTSPVQNVSATVSNVTTSSQVSVSVNGSAISNFTFSNGSVVFSVNLNVGNNAISITGTNAVGNDSKTITISRLQPPPPQITMIYPLVSPERVQNANVNVQATVINVNSPSEINVVSDNGSTVPFSYDLGSKAFTFNYQLIKQMTTFTITASNSNGSDSKTISFKSSVNQAATGGGTIKICHYPNGPTSTPVEMNISATDWPTHQAHGDAQGTCPVQAPKMLICHHQTDGNLSTIEILVSDWPTHQAHGDTEGKCVNEGGNGNTNNSDPMISICHYPPGNTNNPQQLTIPTSAWPAHQAHGDVLGVCPAATGNNNNGGNNGNNGNGNNNNNGGGNNNSTNSDPMISICHYPPGNTNNPQQIQIPASAWPAHQAHGDVLGACPTNKSNTGNNGNGGKTNTVTPGNDSPRNINNGNQVTPKKEEPVVTPPKKVEPVVTPKKVETTVTPVAPKKVESTSTPKTVTPVVEPKKEEKKEENMGTPAPRTIKPR